MAVINKSVIASVLMLIGSSVTAQTVNHISVRSTDNKTKISKHIYGHFAEHLGRCIYGGFYVGESNKKVPHVNGIRKDVVEALKKLKVPNLRWPGGCFADTYHWKDGIGPKADRPKMVNVWWSGVTEDNSFGTHDFLDMCELIGADPYLAGNVGSGTVAEFTDWVQYVSFDGSSPMSSLRAKNGREKPWNVKLWGVGNEAWGCGGNMVPEYYANIYRQYATFMKGSKDMFRIASGANGDDYHWTEVLMRDIPHSILDGVALHHYAVIDWSKKGPSVEFSEEIYFKSMKAALRMEELVSRHSTIMDKYDPQKKVALVVDEWGGWYDVEPGTNPGFLYQQNTMRDAMIAGLTLNIFNNHADRVRIANLAQTINVLQSVILTDEEKMLLTPTFHVMEMYNVHQDATLLPITITTNDYVFKEEKLPAVSISASVDAANLTHVTLVNIDPVKSQNISLAFFGSVYKTATGRILTSGALQDHNTFKDPEKIKPATFNKVTVKNGEVTLTVPPFSVISLELK
ncbi:MAG: alpha-L-arabinofuranosidase C-terminal domain-containing protein [Chryseolinea sp.]